MNGYSIVTLISAILSLIIADFVLNSNRREPLNRVFALLNLFAAYYLFFSFVAQQFSTPEILIRWVKVSFPGITAIACLLHFVLVLTGRQKLLAGKMVYPALYGPPAVFILFALFTDLVVGVPRLDQNGSITLGMPERPFLFYAMGIWLLAVFLISAALLVSFTAKARTAEEKKKAWYFLICFSVPICLDFLQWSLSLLGIKIPDLAPVFLVWMNLFIGYGIWKFDYFRINPVKAVHNIIQTMPDFLILADINNLVVEINPTLEAVLAQGRDHLIGMPVNSFFPTDAINEILRNAGQISNYQSRMNTGPGKNIHVLVSAAYIRKNEKHVIGTVYIIHDVTEMKKAESELASLNRRLLESNRSLNEFAYVASHDLQEPLRKIRSFGTLLTEKHSPHIPEQGKEYIDKMNNAAERMQNLITDLLDYSRIGSGEVELKEISLEELVRDVIEDLEVSISRNGGAVQVSALPVIEGNRLLLRQLFQNLLGNALKFSRPDTAPEIRIFADTGDTPGNCRIIVEDNGIGIPADQAESVFRVFHRLHGKDEYTGSGIGLSICKKVMERHKGSISLTSTVGEGSRFILSFPAITINKGSS